MTKRIVKKVKKLRRRTSSHPPVLKVISTSAKKFDALVEYFKGPINGR